MLHLQKMPCSWLSKQLWPRFWPKIIPSYCKTNQADGCDENPKSISCTVSIPTQVQELMKTIEALGHCDKWSDIPILIQTSFSPAKPMDKTCSFSLEWARYPISDKASWLILLIRILRPKFSPLFGANRPVTRDVTNIDDSYTCIIPDSSIGGNGLTTVVY